MEKNEIGRFYAVSCDNNTLEFIVYDDNTIDCPTLNLDSFNRIVLKPRFVLVGKDFYYTYNIKTGEKYTNSQKLIINYCIDDELFTYLKRNRMISYSTDMAYFYDFIDKNGYGSGPKHYGTESPYKRAVKKGTILQKTKKGSFN